MTIVTSFSTVSKPMSAREMSLTTIASSRLRASFSRAYASAPSPCSAAKPTIVWPGRRAAARPLSTSGVGSSAIASGASAAVFLSFVSAGAAGRKSATAAAISSTSQSANASAHASAQLRRRLDRDDRAPAGAGSETLAAITVTAAPRRAACSASA